MVALDHHPTLKEYRPLLDRLVESLRESLGEKLLSVCLYGSLARDQASEYSDIDLIVVARGEPAEADAGWRTALDALQRSAEYQRLAEQRLWPSFSPYLMTETYLRQETPWVFLEVEADGLVLYDPYGVLAWKLEQVRRRMQELGSKKVMMPDGSWYWDVKPDWERREVFEL